MGLGLLFYVSFFVFAVCLFSIMQPLLILTSKTQYCMLTQGRITIHNIHAICKLKLEVGLHLTAGKHLSSRPASKASPQPPSPSDKCFVPSSKAAASFLKWTILPTRWRVLDGRVPTAGHGTTAQGSSILASPAGVICLSLRSSGGSKQSLPDVAFITSSGTTVFFMGPLFFKVLSDYRDYKSFT